MKIKNLLNKHNSLYFMRQLSVGLAALFTLGAASSAEAQFNQPEINFAIEGGCSGDMISFLPNISGLVNNTQTQDSITQVIWNFGDGTIDTLSVLSGPLSVPQHSHTYTSSGIFYPSLTIVNQNQVDSTFRLRIVISPLITPSATSPYHEPFNSPAGWYQEEIETSAANGTASDSLWEWGVASGNFINTQASGNTAWVTKLSEIYQADKRAWVYSPCFDFTAAMRPMIAFDLWTDAWVNVDGLVIESYNNTTKEWEVLGDIDMGVNWYHSDFVLSRPGNQATVTYPKGWTGRQTGFENARFRLDEFKGQNNVRFRIAFASSPQTIIDTTGNGCEGAAFDNIWIGERNRNVLVENFSNVYATGANISNQSVYDKIFNSAYGLDVSLIQLQTGITSTLGPVYLQNSPDPTARVYFYGISDDNQIILDGMSIGTGISQDLSLHDMDYEMLQFPDFDISIPTLTISGNILSTSPTVTALVAKPQSNYAVHTVVIQDSFTINPSGFNMLSILRKMLPNAGGTPYNQAWAIGNSVTITETWDFSAELNLSSFDPNQLEVIVFIQDLNSKEIFQVQSTQDLNKYTGVGKLKDEVAAEITALKVYPNPSSDFFHIEFEQDLVEDYNWRLVDVAGRVLQTGRATAGTRKFSLEANKLTAGAYFFVINSKTVYAQRKLIVTN